MRKSTLWLVVLFMFCMMAVGWKYTPARLHIKEALSVWMEDLGLQGLNHFLSWRSPGIVLSKKITEEEEMIAAEQQAYAIRQENDLWKTADDSTNDHTGASDEAAAGNKADADGDTSGTDGEKTARNVAGTDSEQTNNDLTESNGTEENKAEESSNDSVSSFSEYIQAAVAGNQLPYSWEQLTDFDYVIEKFYQIHSSTTIYPSQLNLEEFLKKDLSIDRDTEDSQDPQILIYHTHGSEDFKDSDADDSDTLITGVGEVLKEILEEKYGYRVYHDTTVFPYNSSYSEGRELVKNLLKQYPGIQVVIDMHRDSAPNSHLVTEIDGKNTAQIMFFNGMSQTTSEKLTSRSNENLPDNLAFSLQLKLAAEQLYPGFTRKNYLKAYRYNMDLAGRYALIEVGAETNTLEEEINAMEPLAQILNYVLQ